jgi:hypothetical protein
VTALKTPAPDAPASEWGALAVSIPDWRWPDDAFGFGLPIDHWAWEGWLLRLLGGGIYHIRTAIEGADGQTLWQFFCSEPDDAGEQWSAERLPLGRAAIAAAAALGRWPGGAE